MALIGVRRALIRTKKTAAAFIGPGDVVSGATSWWGLRGYNAAYAAPGNNPCVDLVDQAGSNPITVNILANGSLDVASISTWVAAHSVTTIIIVKLYDQVGTTPLTQAFATAPTLVLNALGSLPGMAFNGAQVVTNVSGITMSSTPTISMVGHRIGTALGAYTGTGGAAPIFSNAAGTGFMQLGGSAQSFTMSDSPATTHALQAVFNGASSFAYLDGVSNALATPGSTAIIITEIGKGSSFFLVGRIFELGVWISTVFSGAQQSNMNSNQHTYWGF
jgi:hypothetical protein